ncbi:hypothetical protein NQ318_019475 [Aromia moschata]|uniref:Uncharacterized protein n=1 Tax=Aromia moschata TaxID=1265417 RepID=A0AAV8YAD0_9CUCU|nr:hypothetical protein NQ318_019475 [Aromia moschata]
MEFFVVQTFIPVHFDLHKIPVFSADGNEVIEGNSTSSLKCQYGEKTMKVGQSFKKEAKQYSTDYKVSCKCNIPPLVTCVVDN